MNAIKHWTVDIVLDEHPDSRTTRAEARLHTGDPAQVRGIGRSWRHPRDPETPEIGDELAVARALADLARRLGAVGEAEALDLGGEASHGW
jgi:hypothetical protein